MASDKFIYNNTSEQETYSMESTQESSSLSVQTSVEGEQHSADIKVQNDALSVQASDAGNEYDFSAVAETDKLNVSESEEGDEYELDLTIYNDEMYLRGFLKSPSRYKFSLIIENDSLDIEQEENLVVGKRAYYTKEETLQLLSQKADWTASLAKYGIKDAYIEGRVIHLGGKSIAVPESGGSGGGGSSWLDDYLLPIYDDFGNVMGIQSIVGIASESFLSAKGLDDDSAECGGCFDEELMWMALGGSLTNKVVADQHLPSNIVRNTRKVAGFSLSQDVTVTNLSDALSLSRYLLRSEFSGWQSQLTALRELFNTMFELVPATSEEPQYIRAKLGVASDSFLSAKGLDDDDSAGGGLDEELMWMALGGSLTNKIIADSHISSNIARVSAFSNYFTKAEVAALIPNLSSYYTKEQTDKILTEYASIDFVNSSLSTATATFRGTFETVAALPTTNVNANDYAFVIVEGEYRRYKYNGTSWVFEYTLNNSGYTAEQWSAVNSGITEDLVELIGINEGNIDLNARNIKTNTDAINTLTNRVNEFGESLTTLEGLFDSDGKALKAVNADNASKLGGQLPSYYATTSALAALTTRVSTAESNITALGNNKLNKSVWDSVFEIDANGNLKVKVGLYSPKFISSREADPNTGGGSGGAFSLYTWAQVKALTSEVSGAAPTAYALKQAYNEIGVSLDGKASESSVASLTTRVASLETKATSVSVSQTLIDGTEIGKITIDGVPKALYAPSSIAWGSVTGKPTFATVATSGSYNDLSNKPTIPSLAGYATESWVGSNYFAKSGGTLTNLLLLEYTNPRIAFKSDANTTLGTVGFKDGVLSANIIADNKWYTLLHSGNYSNYALPLSGGTLKGLLVLEYANPRIAFKSDANTTIGAIGAANGVLSAYIAADSSWCPLVHSGNIGSYAQKLDGSNARATKLTSSESLDNYQYGFYSYTNGNNPTNSFGDNTALFAFTSNRGNDTWQIAFDGNGITQTTGPRFGIRGNYAGQGWTSWYRIATTDSTVAAANKLATPRTIWGQSFDGSGDVSSTLYLPNNIAIASANTSGTYKSILRLNSSNALMLGDGTSVSGYNTIIRGNDVRLQYGTSNTNGFILKSSGNVLIGTTTDNGGKLQIEANVPNLISLKRTNAYAGAYIDYIAANAANKQWRVGANDNGSFVFENNNSGAAVNAVVINSSGNVTIGASDLASTNYKFYIDGSALANGSISAAYGDAREINFGASNSLNAITMGVTASGVAYVFGRGNYDMGFSTNSTRRMTITSGGNVGIGTTSPAYKLDVAGVIHSNTGIFSTGYVSARGADTSSDRRLKDNIAPLRNALNYVLNTNYVSFDWKDTREKSIGIIAQEEMGREWGCLVQKHSETYSYLYGQHTALLGAALQEEDRKVEELKAEISRLKAKVNELETRLNS